MLNFVTFESMNFCHFKINRWFIYPYLVLLLGSIPFILIYPSEVSFKMINGQFTESMDIFMPYITGLGEGLAVVIMLLIALFIIPRKCRRFYLIWTILSVVLTSLISHLIKNLVNASRPLGLLKDSGWVHHLESWPFLYIKSFPSAHTSSIFVTMLIISTLLRGPYKVYGLHFLLIATMVGWSRIYLAAHFMEDIVVGSMIGVAIGIITLFLLKRLMPLIKDNA